MPGTLFVVATPIGNLEDITLRALRILREVSVIAAEDTRRTAHLLARHAIATPTTSLHEHNESSKSSALLARLERGDNVALVSDAGTPTISDPGTVLVRRAIEAGMKVAVIPGPSAVTAALAISGVSSETFTFLGFPPNRSKARDNWFLSLAQRRGVLVFFEAPHRVRRTLQDLQAAVGDREIVVCRELTKLHEQLVKGPISTVLERLSEPRGEFTVIVEFGLSTERGSLEPARAEISLEDMAVEIGRLIDSAQMSRRQAVATIARRHHLAVNQVYSNLERLKKSGENT
jgi:16S rRNA (cytidine1402-2'-O)-methyltransferase